MLVPGGLARARLAPRARLSLCVTYNLKHPHPIGCNRLDSNERQKGSSAPSE